MSNIQEVKIRINREKPAVPVEADNCASDRVKTKAAGGASGTGAISGILNRFIEYAIYLLVFLLPLFVLPFTAEMYEFNKIMLLFSVSTLVFSLWIVKMVFIDRKIVFFKTILDIPILIFILAVSASVYFSVDVVSSILGFYGRFSDSLMVYASLAMLYFVSVNQAIIRDQSKEAGKFTDNLLKIFLASSFLAIIMSLAYSFGYKFMPWKEAQFRSFNLVGGSLNIFGVYLLPVVVLSWYYSNKALNALVKYFMASFAVMSVFLLTLIDFISAWAVLLVSAAMLLVLLMKKPSVQNDKTGEGSSLASVFLIAISLVFALSSLSFVSGNKSDFASSSVSSFIKNKIVEISGGASGDGFIREVVLEKKSALGIVPESFKDRLILGSGPGTYLYDFSKYKPLEYNDGVFWNARFDKAGSEILEKISTVGAFGTLSYLLVIVLSAATAAMAMKNSKSREDFERNVYVFTAWFGLLAFQFLYYESAATKFIFWILTIVIVSQYYNLRRDKPSALIVNLQSKKGLFYLSTFSGLISLFAVAAFCYYQFQFYQAEIGYKKANTASVDMTKTESVLSSIEGVKADLEKSIKLNPHRGEYDLYLSRIYMQKVNFLTRQKNVEVGNKEDNSGKIAGDIKNAIDYARSAVKKSPANVVFGENLSFLYESMFRDIGVAGADEWAVKMFQRAMELEPSNPIFHNELGKVYLMQYMKSKAEEKLDLAAREARKSLELKNNYKEAGLQLGLVYEIQGNKQKAIDQLLSLESVERINNAVGSDQMNNFIASADGKTDAEIVFQLGRMYYNAGQIDNAKNMFLAIIKLYPGNSNAHYSLGLIYGKEGANESALREFNLVLSMNPGNKDVMDKIEELKKLIEKKNESGVENPETENNLEAGPENKTENKTGKTKVLR